MSPLVNPSEHYSVELDEALRTFVERPSLLIALDFDGTIAPEVDRPEDARATPDAQDAIQRLAHLPDVSIALVSGRALASLRQVAQVSAEVYLVGSHGAEVHIPGEDVMLGLTTEEERIVAQLGEVLSASVDGIEHAWVEAKPAGFAVHTRLCSEADALVARQKAHEAADALETTRGITLKLRGGKNVAEFAVRETTKGEGIRFLQQQIKPHATLFAGDDVTDEDGFRALGFADLGIKVGEGQTDARYRVASPVEMARVLHGLAELLESR